MANEKLNFVLAVVLTYVLHVNLPFSAAQRSSEFCHTPEGESGECIILESCRSLMKLLEAPRPLSHSSLEYLKKSSCGFEGRTPKVCCPDPKFVQPTHRNQLPTTTLRPDSLKPIDVSDYPALRLLPEECGPIAENKITGGNETSLFEFPWMALLGYVSQDSPDAIQYRCGASLISRNYVLTAAHCVSFLQKLQLVDVRLGEFDQSTEVDCHPEQGCAPPAKNIEVEKIIPHPQYFREELKNDIALIRLKRPVAFSNSIRPICLPVGKEQWRNLDNEKLTVTGWGTTEFGTSSMVLLKVDLPVVPREKCAAIYNRSVPLTHKQMCAGGFSGKDSCSGDSGGPLQFVGQPYNGGLSYIQYGVVSFGPKHCGTAGRPGVYTLVGYYMDWILRNIRP